MNQLEPTGSMTGRRCRLVPVGREHYEYLRRVELSKLGPFWRARGALQSPEEFAPSIWSNVLVQFLAVGVSDDKPLMWLRSYQRVHIFLSPISLSPFRATMSSKDPPPGAAHTLD